MRGVVKQREKDASTPGNYLDELPSDATAQKTGGLADIKQAEHRDQHQGTPHKCTSFARARLRPSWRRTTIFASGRPGRESTSLNLNFY